MSTGRTVAGVAAVVAGLAGLGFLGYYFLKKPASSTTTYPLPFPTSTSEAQSTLVQLDVLWWQSAAQNPGATAYRQSLDEEANQIRAQFPSTGVPSAGYSCDQLVTMGKISSTVCAQAQANGYNPAA